MATEKKTPRLPSQTATRLRSRHFGSMPATLLALTGGTPPDPHRDVIVREQGIARRRDILNAAAAREGGHHAHFSTEIDGVDRAAGPGCGRGEPDLFARRRPRESLRGGEVPSQRPGAFAW